MFNLCNCAIIIRSMVHVAKPIHIFATRSFMFNVAKPVHIIATRSVVRGLLLNKYKM